MGQTFFALPSEKARKLGKKPPVIPQPELEHSGHKFTIVDNCMLKMVSQRQLKVPSIDSIKSNESDEKEPKNELLSESQSESTTTTEPRNELESDSKKQPQTNTNGIIVAAFDMDQTLITTKSGLKFGRNGHDWKFLPHTKEHLKQKLSMLRSENPDQKVVVVIFTNQNGCLPKFSGKSLQYLRTKLAGIVDALPVFDYAFAAMKAPTPELKAQYRKPASGMFDQLAKELESKFKEPVDRTKSFYVGDAAGRPGDHSADDQGFAENAGVPFYVPEEYFK